MVELEHAAAPKCFLAEELRPATYGVREAKKRFGVPPEMMMVIDVKARKCSKWDPVGWEGRGLC